MAANRDWGHIRSGATFEALATALIFFEDPSATLFGRRGRDGGQDARSRDGTHVYQAKHHINPSVAKSIADAKSELAKILSYRVPGHARYSQWQKVTRWTLVTNTEFNPDDEEKWTRDVVPIFAAQGLTAEIWHHAQLEIRLAKHPEIDRSFFANQTRVFLTLPETRERLPIEQPFLEQETKPFFEFDSYFGREAEGGVFKEFLSSEQLFFVVHGVGGIGKTRFLVEAGEEAAVEGVWQVLWANVASMAASSSWFTAIIPERPTLLLFDDPPNEDVLRVLSEQLGGGVVIVHAASARTARTHSAARRSSTTARLAFTTQATPTSRPMQVHAWLRTPAARCVATSERLHLEPYDRNEDARVRVMSIRALRSRW